MLWQILELSLFSLGSEGYQHGGSGSLLTGSTRSAYATFSYAVFSNFAFHVKGLLVRGTQSGDYAVIG